MAYEIALPEDDSGSFGDYLTALKRRRGSVITVLLPNKYSSTATVLIERPEVPPGLVPTTVTTFAAQQLQYITQRVMTRTNLSNIIEKFDLYADERKYMPTLMLVDEAQQDMNIELVDVQTSDTAGRAMTSTIAFTLGFDHEKPKTAQAVANELVSLYLAENVRTRTVQTAETSEFLQQEVDQLDAQVRELEAQVAAFKEENEGSLPSLNAMNLQMMQRLDSELLDLRTQLSGMDESRLVIESQLAILDPLSPGILADGRAVAAPNDQLKALQTEATLLASRYSPDHPDVERIRRQIKAMESELGVESSGVDLAQTYQLLQSARAGLANAREQYTADHPEVKRLERQVERLEEQLDAPGPSRRPGELEADNPAYIQLETRLKTLEIDRQALLRKEAALKKRLDGYEQKLLRSSQVERGLSALMRQLNTASQQYAAAKSKLFSARLGQALETQSKGERFTLVEPADLPLTPSSPNRPVLLTLCLLLGLGGGLGWPQLAATMDRAVLGAKSIQRVFGAPPIAEIPLIVTVDDRGRTRRFRLVFLIGIPLLIIVALALFHVLVRPLDVFWYIAMRRLGI